MIYSTNTVYGKVWKIVGRSDKYMDIQMSTSEKDRDGNYINSSWFPRIIGHAFNELKDTLKEGDRIAITKCKLSNERFRDKDGNYRSAFKFLILEAETEDGQRNARPAKPAEREVEQPKAEPETDECPW